MRGSLSATLALTLSLSKGKLLRRNFRGAHSFLQRHELGEFMRGLTLLGVVLIVLGVAGLLIGHFSYSQTKPVANIGPVHINSEEQHDVSIPTIAGVVVVIAGLGLVFAGRRST
jgi:hypothetical protein